MNNYNITKANRDDLPAILNVQKKAFLEVVKKFHLQSLPALEQSLESLTIDFTKGIILKVSIGNAIVGSVRAHKNNETCHIERLVVLPEYQNQGIGKALMHEIVAVQPVARADRGTMCRSGSAFRYAGMRKGHECI